MMVSKSNQIIEICIKGSEKDDSRKDLAWLSRNQNRNRHFTTKVAKHALSKVEGSTKLRN
jgi:hypothetical protein